MKLDEASLEFSRQHIRSYYASDFFPDADEYAAVWAGWDQVLDHFKNTDAEAAVGTPEDMACAKASGGYRIVHQLTPIDSIAYSALASIIAPHLEARRIPEAEGVSCSYRLDVRENGDFFKPNADGYSIFNNHSCSMAESNRWMLSIDIAGFFNHIYVHRIQSAIEQLDKSLAPVASSLHEILLRFNERASIGIPVGPAASVVVSELVLNEIDQFLRDHRLKPDFTRYVDDFRFFSKSKSNLQQIWHDLARFIYGAYRLTLANGKCRLVSSSRFLERRSELSKSERGRLAATIGISFDQIANDYDGRQVKAEPASGDDRIVAFQSLLESLLRERELNIGLARHVLRRARALRMRCIVRPLVKNLAKVAPVIRDVGLYLNHVLNAKAVLASSAGLQKYFSVQPMHASRSHLHYWIAWLLSGKSTSDQLPGFAGFLENSRMRFRARFARTMNRPQWVRDNRSEWKALASWDRWSIIHAAELLAPAERRAWLDGVERSSDLVDRLVAAKARVA